MEAAEKRTRSHKRAENCFPGEDEDRVDDYCDDYDDGDSDDDGDDDAHRIILLTYTESHHVKGSCQRKGCIPLGHFGVGGCFKSPFYNETIFQIGIFMW